MTTGERPLPTAGRSPAGHAGRPRALGLVAVGLVLFVAGVASLANGAVTLSYGEAIRGLFSDADPFVRNVVWEIRFPRLLDAMLVGAVLGVAGALLQGVTRNPLGDPAILGLTAAAGFGAAMLIWIDPQSEQWAIAAAAVAGGLLGALVLFVIAWRGAISPVRLALAGVAVSAFFGAAIVGLLSSSRTFLQTNLGFLAGGLYGSGWTDLQSALPYALPALALALLVTGRLNVLALGDDIAAGLGVLTDRTRLLIVGIAGVLTGVAVGIAGLAGFVGLVCPHLARALVGQDNRFVVAVSALIGATLVVVADLIARLIIAPSEVPMGILTAAVGAPFLLYTVKFRS